jgi:tRNA (cytidine/uridine-2'-O-)-methyltransferase
MLSLNYCFCKRNLACFISPDKTHESPMFNVILFQPEIPPNTGNIIRLCANTGSQLHLVRPLGFELDDRQLRRAGLDYHEYASVRVHDTLQDCLLTLPDSRLFAFTTKASLSYCAADYRAGDALLFGPESRGLPGDVLESLPADRRLRLPMRPDSRSLNLSNTVAIAVFEAWRQCGFAGARKNNILTTDVSLNRDTCPPSPSVPLPPGEGPR